MCLIQSTRTEETAKIVNRTMRILSHQLRTVLPTGHDGHPFQLTILSHLMGPRRFDRSCIKGQNNGAGIRTHMTATAGPTVTSGVAPIFQSRHLSTEMRIVAAILYFLSRSAMLTHRVRLSMCSTMRLSTSSCTNWIRLPI